MTTLPRFFTVPRGSFFLFGLRGTGNTTWLREVVRECETSRSTVSGYLELLEDLLLAFRLPVFSRRAKRRLLAHPRFFYFDCGVFRSLRPSGPLDRPN